MIILFMINEMQNIKLIIVIKAPIENCFFSKSTICFGISFYMLHFYYYFLSIQGQSYGDSYDNGATMFIGDYNLESRYIDVKSVEVLYEKSGQKRYNTYLR